MHIILGKENAREVDAKYVVLELDSMLLSGSTEPVTAYCLVEKISLTEMLHLDSYITLHNNTMRNYRLKNWKYCEDALEHLMGRWNGELDTFYSELGTRIAKLKTQDLDENWTGVIDKSVLSQ